MFYIHRIGDSVSKKSTDDDSDSDSDSDEDIDKFKTDLSKNDLKKLLKHLKSLNLGDVAFAGSDLNDGKLKIRNSGIKKDDIQKVSY